MAEENQSQIQGSQIEDDSSTALNPDEGSGSPPDEGKLRALEEQLARERQEKQALAESVRLQERLLREQNAQNRNANRDDESPLSAELDALDKTLAPILDKRLKKVIEPLVGTQAGSKEELDAIRFETFLGRHDPEIFDDEQRLTQLNQQVHEVRQRAAREYGTWLSRQDAYGFVLGIESLKEKGKKRSQQARAETVRLGQGRLAQSDNLGHGRSNQSGGLNPKLDAALRKMRAGEKRTPEEKELVRNYLGSVEF